MKARLNQTYIANLPVPEKAYWITDETTPNLRLHVGKSGVKTWYACYRLEGSNKKQSHKIGAANLLTVHEARDKAKKIAAKIINGENPKEEKKQRITFGVFLDEHYEGWAVQNQKSSVKNLRMLRSAFDFLLSSPVDSTFLTKVEKWKTKKINAGVKAATVNRCIASLKAAINWGVKRSYIPSNPLDILHSLPQSDSKIKDRYLSDDERKRLMIALDKREEKLRKSKNRDDQSGEPQESIEFSDYLKPMILISLNTGIRQNSLFSLMWKDVDLEKRTLTLRAAINKSGKVQYLPLNASALEALTIWRSQSDNTEDDALVFPSPKTREKLDNCKKAWASLLREAGIKNFRWHDMRHDFASQLVMKGIDLNTVRELMGHSDIKITLRYAHLAPEKKLSAVEKLEKS